MVSEVVVRNGDGSGTHNSINKAISTIGKRTMVYPNMTRTKNRNSITISHCPPTIMGRRAADQGIASGLAVMNMNTMNDNVGDELNGNASTISNVDVGAAAIDGLEAVQDEFLSESDDHVMIEDDPEGL